MAPPTISILEFLTRPNPPVTTWKLPGGGNTTHHKWDPIEGTRELKGFTYNNCYQDYKADIKKPINPTDFRALIANSHFNEVVNEDTVTILMVLSCLLPVNLALQKVDKNLHFGPGSKFFLRQEYGSPDWGLGGGEFNEGFKTLFNFCPIDIKSSSKWTSEGLLDPKINWANYTNNPKLQNQARPLEQIQHYCTSLNKPWGGILTDREFCLVRVTKSEEKSPSPKPTRSTVGHQRGVSTTSTLSSDMSAMSLDASMYSGTSSGTSVAPLEILSIPWSAEGEKKMTIKLALYYVARLAYDNTPISTWYPPFDSKPAKSIPENSQTKTGSASSKTGSASSKPASKDRSKTIFIQGAGIDAQVLYADIDVYIPGAEVTEDTHDGKNGYKVRYEKGENLPLHEILKYMKSDTEAWRKEDIEDYTDSQTYKRRDQLRCNEI